MAAKDSAKFDQPVSGTVTPRFGGIATFMRLPHVPLDKAEGIDIGLAGIPWDAGTTNRPGPRHGPRQLRDNSAMVRRMHQVFRMSPYDIANCADLGDCPVNPADVQDGLKRVETWFKALVAKGIRPLVGGGDHLCSLPVLRAVGEKRPVGMIHFDAHTDLYDEYFGGFRFTHGTPFRRAIEEGLLDPKRVVQIGIRGSMYDAEDVDYAKKVGVRIIRIEEAMEKGSDAVMAEARRVAGDGPTYVSFDIDMLDPVYAPRHRYARGRRLHHIPGTADAARFARAPYCRRRRGRSVATLRSLRRHRLCRRHDDVRDPVFNGRRCGEAKVRRTPSPVGRRMSARMRRQDEGIRSKRLTPYPLTRPPSAVELSPWER